MNDAAFAVLDVVVLAELRWVVGQEDRGRVLLSRGDVSIY
jgi:hypothetical protein